jgi:hypothetical protein
MYVIKEELDHSAEKFAKIIKKFLCQKGPDPDPAWQKSSGSGSTTQIIGRSKFTTAYFFQSKQMTYLGTYFMTAEMYEQANIFLTGQGKAGVGTTPVFSGLVDTEVVSGLGRKGAERTAEEDSLQVMRFDMVLEDLTQLRGGRTSPHLLLSGGWGGGGGRKGHKLLSDS